jgi:hypothetical protein
VSQIANTIVTMIVLLAPFGLGYGWYFYFAKMSKEPLRWRGRVTVVALGLVSLEVVMWPIYMITAPKANWSTGVGVEELMHWADTWERTALRICLAALVVSLLGRPRLILPIVIACVGTGLFWIFSNIP